MVMLVTNSLPPSLSHSCLVNLSLIIDYLCVKMPPQNLLRFVTVANVDDEDRVGNSLMHTWELKLGNNAKLLVRL